MDIKDLNKMKSILHLEYKEKCKKLDIQFAKENNPYKIGDIISSNGISIKIEVISVYLDVIPKCKYTGTKINKDGKYVTYDEASIKYLDKQIELCFEYLGDEIYEIGFDLLMPRIQPAPKN